MRVDFYTRAVLTVIAACLVWMCFSGSEARLAADGQGTQKVLQPVHVVGWVDANNTLHTLPPPYANKQTAGMPVDVIPR